MNEYPTADQPQSEPGVTLDNSPKRQISLRGLFLSTAYFAISSALATRFGLGIFVLMNGVFLTWLSFRGFLWWMQTIRTRPRTYRLAWLLFAISFGLPALSMKGCGTGPPKVSYGWQAALFTINGVTGSVDDAMTAMNSPGPKTLTQIWHLSLSILMALFLNLPNALMLLSPLVLYRQQREKGRVLSLLFHCAALSTWTWGVIGGSDLRIGYYVWSVAITAVALARRPSWRTLAVLAALGAILLIAALAE